MDPLRSFSNYVLYTFLLEPTSNEKSSFHERKGPWWRLYSTVLFSSFGLRHKAEKNQKVENLRASARGLVKRARAKSTAAEHLVIGLRIVTFSLPQSIIPDREVCIQRKENRFVVVRSSNKRLQSTGNAGRSGEIRSPSELASYIVLRVWSCEHENASGILRRASNSPSPSLAASFFFSLAQYSRLIYDFNSRSNCSHSRLSKNRFRS